MMDTEWEVKLFYPPESEIPTREMHEPWIRAFSSIDYETVDLDKVGKWLLFLDCAHRSEVTGLTHHDYVWQFIKKLAEDDVLYHAKCSTSLEGVYEPHSKSQNGVICCYTLDYTDKQDVKRAADAIRRAVHVPRDMFYKTDNDTRAGKYRHQGDKHVSIYKHTTESDMFERDPVIKYKWNRVYIWRN